MERCPVDAPDQLPVDLDVRFLPWGAETGRVMSQLVDEVGRVVGIGREEHADVDVDFNVEPADTQKLGNSGEPCKQNSSIQNTMAVEKNIASS
jgi:hypothetical protein